MSIAVRQEGSLADAMKDAQASVARAAKATMTEAAKIMLARGRADIAGAGFGRRWQDGLKVTVSQKDGGVDATLTVRHTIPFAGVFEQGATIRGRPLLWIPAPSTPRTIGGKPMTVARYEKQFGPLFLIQGRRPVLARRAGRQLIPAFVGLDSTTIRKRFHIGDVAKGVASELGSIYDRKFK